MRTLVLPVTILACLILVAVFDLFSRREGNQSSNASIIQKEYRYTKKDQTQPKQKPENNSKDAIDTKSIATENGLTNKAPFLRNPQYLCQASMSNADSLIIEYQSRQISDNEELKGPLNFRFEGVLRIHSEINGLTYFYTMEDFIKLFPKKAVDGNRMISMGGDRISFDTSKNELIVRPRTMKISDSEFVLISGYLPIDPNDDSGITYHSVSGYLADVYFREMASKFSIMTYNIIPYKTIVHSIEDKILSVVKGTDEQTMIFSATTDLHGDPFFENKIDGGRNMAYSAINYLHERISPDFHIDLGDGIPEPIYFKEKNEFLSNFISCKSEFKNVKRQLRVIGNHDYNSKTAEVSNLSHYLTFSEVFNAWGRGQECVWGSKSKFYYYVDFEEYKIRVVVLNTSENDVSFDSNGDMETPDPVNHSAMLQDQFDWLVNTALVFSDKGADRINWHTIIISHIPLSPKYERKSDLENIEAIHDILKAFKTGRSGYYHHTDELPERGANVSISYDFRSQGPMTLVGCISGHTHIQHNDFDSEGIAYRVLPSGFCNTTSHPGQVFYSENGYSAAIISIDKSKRKMKCVFLGYGDDWEISY